MTDNIELHALEEAESPTGVEQEPKTEEQLLNETAAETSLAQQSVSMPVVDNATANTIKLLRQETGKDYLDIDDEMRKRHLQLSLGELEADLIEGESNGRANAMSISSVPETEAYNIPEYLTNPASPPDPKETSERVASGMYAETEKYLYESIERGSLRTWQEHAADDLAGAEEDTLFADLTVAAATAGTGVLIDLTLVPFVKLVAAKPTKAGIKKLSGWGASLLAKATYEKIAFEAVESASKQSVLGFLEKAGKEAFIKTASSFGKNATKMVTEYDEILKGLTHMLSTKVSHTERAKILTKTALWYGKAGMREMREGLFFNLVAGGLALTDLNEGAKVLGTIVGGIGLGVLLSIPRHTAQAFWYGFKARNPASYADTLAKLNEAAERYPKNKLVRAVREAAANPVEGKISISAPIAKAAQDKDDIAVIKSILLSNAPTEADYQAVKEVLDIGAGPADFLMVSPTPKRFTANLIDEEELIGDVVAFPTEGNGLLREWAEAEEKEAKDAARDKLLDVVTRHVNLGGGRSGEGVNMGRVVRTTENGDLVIETKGKKHIVPKELAVKTTGLSIDEDSLRGILQNMWKRFYKTNKDRFPNMPEKLDLNSITFDYRYLSPYGATRASQGAFPTAAVDALGFQGSGGEKLNLFIFSPGRWKEAAQNAKFFTIDKEGNAILRIWPNTTIDELKFIIAHELGHLTTYESGLPLIQSEARANLAALRTSTELGIDMNNVRPFVVAGQIEKAPKNLRRLMWELYDDARSVINSKTQVGQYTIAQYAKMIEAGREDLVALDIRIGAQVRNLDVEQVLRYVTNMPSVQKARAVRLEQLVDIEHSSGTPLNAATRNALILNNEVGDQALADLTPLGVGVRETAAKDVLTRRFNAEMIEPLNDGATITFDRQHLNIKTFLKNIFSPSTVLGNAKYQLAETPYLLHLQGAKLTKAAADATEIALKGLDTRDTAVLLHALEYGRDNEVRLVATRAGLYDPNKKQVVFAVGEHIQDAYNTIRYLMDAQWSLVNNAAIRNARLAGELVTDMGEVIIPVKKPTAAIMEGVDTQGITYDPQKHLVYRYRNDPGKVVFVPKDKVGFKEIPDGFDYIGYHAGYMTRLYSQPHRIMRMRITPEGGVQTEFIATAETMVEANQAITHLRDANPEWSYVAARNVGGVFQISNSADTVLANMSPTQLEGLAVELRQLGFDIESVDQLKRYAHHISNNRPSFLRHRGDTPLKSGKDLAEGIPLEDAAIAPLRPIGESFAQSQLSAARYTALSEYQARLAEEYRKTFGMNWWEDIPKSASSPDLQNARVIQKQIKKIAGYRDDMLYNFANRWRGTADAIFGNIGEKNPVYSEIAKVIEKGLDKVFGGIENATRNLRLLSFDAKLGLFNMSQFITQATGVLNSVGIYGVRYSAVGATDFLEAFAWHRSGQKLAPLRTKDGTDLWQLAQRSGFFDSVNFEAVQTALEGNYGKTSFLGKTRDAGRIFYEAGETVNRGVAWFTTRRKMLDEVKSGVLWLEPDSAAFLSEVNRRAAKVSLNMSIYNQPRIAEGLVGATFGQYKQFFFHQLELFGDINNAQRMRLLAAWVGMFGLGGVPFVDDVALISEHAANKYEDIRDFLTEYYDVDNEDGVTNPIHTNEYINSLIMFSEQYGEKFHELTGATLKDAIKKGASGVIPYIRDFEIASRVGLSSVIGSYIEGLDAGDLAGPGLMTLYQLAGGAVKLPSDMLAIIRNAETTDAEKVGAMFRGVAENFTAVAGVRNVATAAAGALEGKLMRGGELLIEDPTWEELTLLGIGLRPTTLVEITETRTLQIRRNAAWKTFIAKRAKQYTDLAANNPDMAFALMYKDAERIMKFAPDKAKKWMVNVAWKMMELKMPADRRVDFQRRSQKILRDWSMENVEE